MATSDSLTAELFSPIAIPPEYPVKAPVPVVILLVPFATAPLPQAIASVPGALPRVVGFPVSIPLTLTVQTFPPYSFLSSVVIVPAAIAAARKHNLFLNFPFCVFLSSFFFLLIISPYSQLFFVYCTLYQISYKNTSNFLSYSLHKIFDV